MLVTRSFPGGFLRRRQSDGIPLLLLRSCQSGLQHLESMVKVDRVVVVVASALASSVVTDSLLLYLVIKV